MAHETILRGHFSRERRGRGSSDLGVRRQRGRGTQAGFRKMDVRAAGVMAQMVQDLGEGEPFALSLSVNRREFLK